MNRRAERAQISNCKTSQMYLRQLLALAENVFDFKNLPNFIDKSFLNKTLLRQGAIAFFIDEVLGLLALPFLNIGTLDVYGRPKRIQVYSQNGYRKTLNNDEFIIMYDNNGRYPLYLDILQYAERIALSTRTIDINILQQRTPRFWKCKTENEQTVKNIINNVDSLENVILAYKSLDLDDISIVLEPAPYVADKIDLHKEKDWNEFLRLIGIANTNFQKKERNIKDEVIASQGGTIASRFNRFDPRKTAVEEINKKFINSFTYDGKPVLEKELEVSYYDGIPSTENIDDFLEDGSDENYDI